MTQFRSIMLLLLFTVNPYHSLAQIALCPDFEFRINLHDGPSLWGDVRFIEVVIENASLSNIFLELPFPHENLFSTVNATGQDRIKDSMLVEWVPSQRGLFAIDDFNTRPGQTVSTVSLILAHHNSAKKSEVFHDQVSQSFGAEQPNHLDLEFRHSIGPFASRSLPRPYLNSQNQIIVKRLVIRDCVIIGKPDVIANEMIKLHTGEDRAVRSPLIPDFALRYQGRKLLNDRSNLAMIYDFSKEYLQLIEMHPDSSEAFIQGLDRLIARMNEVERRRILLDVGNDITKRAEKHKALFLKRFYHDQPSLHCYRLN